VLYRLLIYIMLSREGKFLKIINCLKLLILLCFIHMTCQIGLYQLTLLTMNEIFVLQRVFLAVDFFLHFSCTFHIRI
jgi:hypothetical protein